MARIDLRVSDEVKKKLEKISKEDNRSQTKEIIYLIERRAEELETE